MGAEEFSHFADGLLQPDEDGARNNGVPDVERVEMWHVLDKFADVVVVEAVTGVDPHAHLVRVNSRARVPGDFLATRATGGRVGVRAGVQLDSLSADAVRGIDLREFGVDKGADLDFRDMKFPDDEFEPLHIAGDIKPALGGDFLAVLRHETNFLRLDADRMARHGRGRGHFEIERDEDVAGQFLDVGILNMAAILPQMDGDGGDAGLLRDPRRFKHAGFGRKSRFPTAVTGLAQSGHMIDV